MTRSSGTLRGRSGHQFLAVALLFAVILWTAAISPLYAQELTRRPADKRNPPATILGLISRATLSPPLRSRLRALRFSPNGAYILLQDETTAYVIQTNPLAVVSTFASSQMLPIRFSADSQSIIGATLDMTIERSGAGGSKPAETRTLGGGGSCYAAALSLDGELYACLYDKSDLRIFQTRTGEQIFQGHVGEPVPPRAVFPTPRHMGLARSEPFGYYLSSTRTQPNDSTRTTGMLQFSMDARFLAARGLYSGSETLIDLQRRAPADVPKKMKRAIDQGSIEFVAPDRVVFSDPDKKLESELLSFPSGDVISKLDVGGSFTATSNPRYAINTPEGSRESSVIDLQTGKSVASLGGRGGDVWGAEVLSETNDGVLTLTQIGGAQPLLQALTPVSPLPPLRTAAVSSDLSAITIGVPGQAGVFEPATGRRTADFDGLRGAWFSDDHDCYILVPGASQKTPATIENVDARSGTTSSPVSLQENAFREEDIFSGPVLLSHYLKVPVFLPGMQEFPFELRGLDPSSGKPLWTRSFDISPSSQYRYTPIPFTDPQGDRVVLGWRAKAPGGQAAADRDAGVKRLMKSTKLSEHDSLFEVLDARTGKMVGAALVQTGAEAASFDSAFSEGDWLVLEKNGRSAIVFSLSTGQQVAQETGYAPTISAAAGLLSVTTDGGHLELYDLKARTQRYTYQFPQEIAYSHFSADGGRLLVLTEDQTVYVLDMSKIPAAPAPQP